jgi:hypothetical protein
VFHVFGDSAISLNGLARKVAFEFQYTAISASNTDQVSAHTTVDLSAYTPDTNPVPVTNPVVFDLMDGVAAYTAYTSRKILATGFTVPGSFITSDAVVSFKILRQTTSDSYTGNIGLLATYWEIPN